MANHRLPIVNNDDGTWGTLLVDWLTKEHVDTGSLAPGNGGHQNVSILGSAAGAAGTAPLKFASGTNLVTPEAGVIEYNGSDFYMTPSGTNRYKIVGDTYAQTLSNKTIDNTNAITVKDANLTIQNSTTTTKTFQFDASSLTASSPRTFKLPDTSTTLVGQEIMRAGNVVVGGDFEDDSQWQNAFGAQSLAQHWGGTKSRVITASGAGPTADRLVLTHDATGTPMKVISDAYRWWSLSAYIRKDAANTGTAAPAIYLDMKGYDTSGTEINMYSSTNGTAGINEGTLSSTQWFNFSNTFLTNANTIAIEAMVTIDSATPVSNKYYIDQVILQEVSPVGNMTIQMSNKTIDNTNKYITYTTTTNFTLGSSVTYNSYYATVVFADATSNNVTITVPAANTSTGQRYDIKRKDSSAHIVTVLRSGSDTIDGAASWTLDMQYTSISIISDGSAWYIL